MKEEEKRPEDEKTYNIFKEGSKNVKVLVKETFSFATQESVTGLDIRNHLQSYQLFAFSFLLNSFQISKKVGERKKRNLLFVLFC